MRVKVFEVTAAHTEKQFLDLPRKLYRHDENRSIPLGVDVAQVFDRNKNSLLCNGHAKRWIVYDEYNLPVGRIAAFFNHDVQREFGGIGFFECGNDEQLSASLFDTATTWLKSHGCRKIDGPINFGEKDRFWGLLTSGFDGSGLYLDNYNPPYYENQFRQFGFTEKDEISTFCVPLSGLPAKRIEAVAQRLIKKENITFRCMTFSDAEKMARDFHDVYTASFKEYNRIKHLTETDILHMMNGMRIVLEEKFVWLAYHDDVPVGLLAFMKDLNQMKRLSSKRYEATNLKGFALSVVPAFQNRGVELGLCHALYQSLKADNKNYILYFSGVNSTTGKMISFLESLNASRVKTHKTFTINF